MTPSELAAHLTGREYPCRELDNKNNEFPSIARNNGLVIIFGCSDDLMELRGAINDEVGCYDGGSAFVDKEGLLPSRESIDDDEELKKYFARQPNAKEIKALWCEEKDSYSWTYETTIPHAKFEVLEDGEPYCLGIVFALADV